MIELLLQAERALAMGLVDHAERLYLQAVAADPLNSIAVVGLARVALERADDVEAYRRARQALRIDPENVAAVRLSERLEEVFTQRGQALPPIEPAITTRPAPTPTPAPTLAPVVGAPTLAQPTESHINARSSMSGDVDIPGVTMDNPTVQATLGTPATPVTAPPAVAPVAPVGPADVPPNAPVPGPTSARVGVPTASAPATTPALPARRSLVGRLVDRLLRRTSP